MTTLKPHEIKIINALTQLKTGSCYGIAALTELRPDQVFRRMRDLAEMGLIIETGKKINGPNGHPCTEWRLNGKGGWNE